MSACASRTQIKNLEADTDSRLPPRDDPTLGAEDDQLRLEQDVIAPLADHKKLYVYQAISPWIQIKSAASAVPANALVLASYGKTNPSLLRRRSPTITAESRADRKAQVAGKQIKAEM